MILAGVKLKGFVDEFVLYVVYAFLVNDVSRFLNIVFDDIVD
jgi:hypothetical protein